MIPLMHYQRGTFYRFYASPAELKETIIDDAIEEFFNSTAKGGGLATAAIQEVITRNTSTPDKLALISPWLNLAIDDPSSASIDDPFCSIEALQQSGRLWAGKDTVDAPIVSPIHGNFKGFPTTHVYAGSRDILFPDSLKLQELAQEEKLPFSFDLREGLIHGWAGFTFIPEGKEVYPRILKFLIGK